MSYQTLEVELVHGQVRPHRAETLPIKARALLTILDSSESVTGNPPTREAGLRRFLTQPDFVLTPEQYRASMEPDFWEQ